MQRDSGLSESMMFEEVVKHADNCIGPLPDIRCLVYHEVDLSGNGFTAYPKQGSLPGCHEVDGARLPGVAGVVQLLSEVEGIMHNNGVASGLDVAINGWWGEASILSLEGCSNLPLALLNCSSVAGALLSY